MEHKITFFYGTLSHLCSQLQSFQGGNYSQKVKSTLVQKAFVNFYFVIFKLFGFILFAGCFEV